MNPSGLFTETMDVYAGSYISVASAGMQRAESLKASAKACRVEDASSDQQRINLALGVRMTHRVFTLYDGIVNGDSLHVGGLYFRIVGVSKRRAIGNMDTFYVLDAEEISG